MEHTAMTMIDNTMRNLFIETYKLYELEKQFNYQNYGKYPYRDRKNSVQIVADFNVDAYSVNGLFVAEESYLQYYPPEVIESVELVLIESSYVQDNLFQAIAILDGSEEPTLEMTIEEALAIRANAELYENIVSREFVEVEAVEVQTMRYLFPFTTAFDAIGRMIISL